VGLCVPKTIKRGHLPPPPSLPSRPSRTLNHPALYQLVEAYEGYAACAALKEAGDLIHAFAECQDTEDVLYQQWAGNPFIYDIRQPNGVFDKLTGVLTTYFNSDEVSTRASARGCSQGTGANSSNSSSCVRVRPTALPELRACSRRC